MRPGATSEDPASTLADHQEPAPGTDSAVREGVAATEHGAAALVPGGRPEEQAAADGSEPSARAERRRRLQGLAGLTVLGSDGRTVGRVRDIYQHDDSGELAAITVMPRQLSSRSVLIPSAAITALPASPPAEGPDLAEGSDLADGSDGSDGSDGTDGTEPAGDSESTGPQPADVVRLRIATAAAKAGLKPPDTGHATPQMLREAAEALGLHAAEAPGSRPAAAEAPGARKAAEDA